MANSKARGLRGRLVGPQIARPASCVADVRPVQAEAERKHERKGAGAEVEEARAHVASFRRSRLHIHSGKSILLSGQLHHTTHSMQAAASVLGMVQCSCKL